MHILIIGAGPTGLTLALSLAKIPNVTFTVFEARPSMSTIGGAVNLTPTALRYLDAIGVYQRLLEKGAHIKSIDIFSLHSGAKISEIDFLNPKYGYQALRVKRADLMQAFLEIIEEQGLTSSIEWDKKLSSINDTHSDHLKTVTFADSTTATGNLILGCDGIHSLTRTSYVDPTRTPEYTGMAVAYGFLPTSAVTSPLHFQDTAMMSSQKGALLMSYTTKKRDELFLSGVMRVPEEEGREGWRLKGEDKEAVKRDMIERFGALITSPQLSCITEALTQIESLAFYPVSMLPSPSYPSPPPWTKSTVLLLGDAAHAMPPQGESTGLCIEDAILFTHILSRRWAGLCTTPDTANNANDKTEAGKNEGKGRNDLDVLALCRYFEDLRKPVMLGKVRESVQRWGQAQKGSWLLFKIVEVVTPWWIWWSQAQRDREFGEDVREWDV